MIPGKRNLCYVNLEDFDSTSVQAIGSDYIYKRYDSVSAVLNKIDKKYRSFLAEPIYSHEDGIITWYTELWKDENPPMLLNDLDEDSKIQYTKLFKETVKHYKATIETLIGDEKRALEAALKYINNDFVYVVNDYVVLAVWGMEVDQFRYNATGTIIHECDFTKYYPVTFYAGEHGKLANSLDSKINCKVGTELQPNMLPSIIANEGFEFEKWEPNPMGVKVEKPLSFSAVYREIEKPLQMCTVKFLTDDVCTLDGNTSFLLESGSILDVAQIPHVTMVDGYSFDGWDKDVNLPITEDVEFHPLYTKDELPQPMVYVSFNVGKHGTTNHPIDFEFPQESVLPDDCIPYVNANKNYRFIGWDIEPYDLILDQDITFNAIYEKTTLPWWKRFWLWIGSWKGCLLKFLGFLALLLLFLLLLSLLRSCNGDVVSADDTHNGPAVIEIGDSTHQELEDNIGFARDGRIGDVPSTPIDDADLGGEVDPGNGGGDYHVGVIKPSPEQPPIDNPDNPHGPQIIPNVINVFFADNNANLNAFAGDFRDIYPDTEKYQLDYDDLVKRITIMMPAEERVTLKREIERRLGRKYDFFIVDEYAIRQGSIAQPSTTETDAGWHLLAVNAMNAWETTIGDPEVIVAVVDDGFDVTHRFFKNKIVAPYNVFTKDATLTYGSGHGTHTAGLAVGFPDPNIMASGIAPACKLMPVQVFMDEMSILSAEISGIAYAIHNGADVVNISMGGDYSRFQNVSLEEQMDFAEQYGEIEEQLWNRVFQMAQEHNTVLVFSAGNDNVLSYINPQNRPDSLISVTAIDQTLKKSLWHNGKGSNNGLGSTIAAPGTNIYSSIPVDDFGMMDGTSMAAPIVAGVVALLKSVKKDITIGETIDILIRSGKPLADNTLGPLVQADRALALLTTGQLPEEGESTTENDENNTHAHDYSAIFQKIAEHQRAIIELIKQLPPEEQERYLK